MGTQGGVTSRERRRRKRQRESAQPLKRARQQAASTDGGRDAHTPAAFRGEHRRRCCGREEARTAAPYPENYPSRWKAAPLPSPKPSSVPDSSRSDSATPPRTPPPSCSAAPPAPPTEMHTETRNEKVSARHRLCARAAEEQGGSAARARAELSASRAAGRMTGSCSLVRVRRFWTQVQVGSSD